MTALEEQEDTHITYLNLRTTGQDNPRHRVALLTMSREEFRVQLAQAEREFTEAYDQANATPTEDAIWDAVICMTHLWAMDGRFEMGNLNRAERYTARNLMYNTLEQSTLSFDETLSQYGIPAIVPAADAHVILSNRGYTYSALSTTELDDMVSMGHAIATSFLMYDMIYPEFTFTGPRSVVEGLIQGAKCWIMYRLHGVQSIVPEPSMT